VAIVTRPGSVEKSDVQELKKNGVDIRIGDLATDSESKLKELLHGVAIVISAVNWANFQDQRRLFAAAKALDTPPVVIPCDWGTYTPKGIRELSDEVCTIPAVHPEEAVTEIRRVRRNMR
jgi:hypothetical protein